MLKIFNSQTKSINSAALILAATSFISAVLGLIRDRLLAQKFGLGEELDIYYAAFRLPDFIATTLVIGAIGAAIIPIFSERLVRGREEAFQYLSNLLNLFFVFLVLISGVLFIFAPKIVALVAPGFLQEKKEAVILLTRIMLLSPIFLGLGNVVSGVLRVFQRFFVTSTAPIMYNLGIIAGILFFFPLFGLQGLAWGVVFGGFLHLAVQLPILGKLGFRSKKILELFEPNFIKTLKLTFPRSIGLAANQINLVVATAIASTLPSGGIAAMNLADNLSRPILTFIGVSFSTAAFPALSLAFSKKDKEKFREIFYPAFSKIIILTLPISFLFFLFRDFIIGVILKAGSFGSADAKLTASLFAMFLLGIFAQALLLLVAKAFYALQNTKTPAIVSILGMLGNIFFSLLFVKLLSYPNSFYNFFVDFLNLRQINNIQVLGLPLAVSLSAILQFLILFAIFQRKKNSVFKESPNL